MEGQHAWSLPAACPITAIAPDLSQHLLSPALNEPTSFNTCLPPLGDVVAVPEEAVLLRAAEILRSTQVQYVQSRVPLPQSTQGALSLLQISLLQLAPGVLGLGPLQQHHFLPPPQPHWQQQHPPHQQQQQQQHRQQATPQHGQHGQQQQHLGKQQPQQQQQRQTQASAKQRPSIADSGDQPQIVREESLRKRKRRTQTDETFVGRAVDPAHAADAARGAIDAFLVRWQEQLQQPGRMEVDSEDDGDEEEPPGLQELIPIRELRALNDCLAAAKGASVLHTLPLDQLRQLLQLLHSHVRLGAQQAIPDEHDVTSGTYRRSVAAMDAAACCLQILAAHNMPNELYQEEFLTSLVDLTKMQLQTNVLAFYDPRLRRMYRPSLAQDDAKGPAKRTKVQQAKGVPAMVSSVIERVELLLQLLADVVGRVRLEVEALLPLVRVGLNTLTVDNLHVLQMNSVGLAVSVFQHHPLHRGSIMEEVLSGVFGQMGSKNPPRHFIASAEENGGGVVRIQMATALIMQLVQAAAEVPEIDADVEKVMNTFAGAVAIANVFWDALFERLPSAKAVKSDTAQDYKALVENLLADLLAVQMLPQWPVAQTLLRRAVKVLSDEKGLHHADSSVKLMSVEFTGQVVVQLFREALQAEEDEPWVKELLEHAGDAMVQDDDLQLNPSDHLVHALMHALHHSGSTQGQAACRFTCSRLLHDAVQHQLKLKGGDPQNVEPKVLSDLVLYYRQLQEGQALLVSSGGPFPLDAHRAGKVARRIFMEGPLGPGRMTLVKWLVEAGDRSRQDANAAQVRAKAVKALGGIVEVDTRVLGLTDMRLGLQNALKDEAVSVREAAVELLAKYLSSNPDLAADYFEVICTACQDQGISVRKRAVKTLWDCCVRCPGFQRTVEGMVVILHRAGDPEESMRSLVTKICSAMWFTPGLLVDAEFGSSSTSRSAGQRAKELAEVCLMVYEKGGKGIHVPLAPEHALVVVMKESLAVSPNSSSSSAAVAAAAGVHKGAEEVALSLKDLVVRAQGDDLEDGSQSAFGPLLALHALCCALPTIAIPSRDPQTVLRALAPYVTSAEALEAPPAKGAPRDLDKERRGAEETVTLLSILDALLKQLSSVEKEILQQMLLDLDKIVNRHRFWQVMARAAQCMCTMCPLLPDAVTRVAALAARCWYVADSAISEPGANHLTTPIRTTSALNQLPRFLFILGQFCRYGSHTLDSVAAQEADAAAMGAPALPPNKATPDCKRCLELFVRVWGCPSAAGAQERALEAMGLVFIARPGLMLEMQSSLDVYLTALRQGPQAIKARVLANIVDLLRFEEESMVTRQQASEAAAAAAYMPSTLPAKDNKPLARQNGEGDDSSVASGILQRLWQMVLLLATQAPESSMVTGVTSGTPGTPRTPVGNAEAASANMRRKALELIEVALRGGMVAPWTAVPALIALLTDQQLETRTTALRVLKGAAEKYADFVGSGVSEGVTEAFAFHRRLWLAKHPGQPLPRDPDPNLVRGLTIMYADVIQGDNKLRPKFLHSLFKPFEDACSVAVGSRAAASDPHLLAFCTHLAANLPCKRGDEPLTMLHSMNGIISRLGHVGLDKLKVLLIGMGLQQDMGLDLEEVEDAGRQGLVKETQQAGTMLNNSQHAAADGGSSSRGWGPESQQQQGTEEFKAVLKASLGLSMLLVLKQYMMAAYGLSDDRVAQFELKGEKKRAEEKTMVSRRGLEFTLNALDLRCLEDSTGNLLVGHFKTFHGLMEHDAANWKEQELYALMGEGSDEDHENATGIDSALVHATPALPGGEAPAKGQHPKPAGLQLFAGDAAKKPPRTGGSVRSRGGGSTRGKGTGKRGGRSAAKGTGASTHGVTGGKKRRRTMSLRDSDEEDGDTGVEDEDYNPSMKLW